MHALELETVRIRDPDLLNDDDLDGVISFLYKSKGLRVNQYTWTNKTVRDLALGITIPKDSYFSDILTELRIVEYNLNKVVDEEDVDFDPSSSPTPTPPSPAGSDNMSEVVADEEEEDETEMMSRDMPCRSEMTEEEFFEVLNTTI